MSAGGSWYRSLRQRFRQMVDRLIRYLKDCANPTSHLPKKADDEALREYLDDQARLRRTGLR